MNSAEFLKLRQSVIEKEFSNMNDMQLRAVTTVKGPLLVLAGAGSGKTTVLVNRIAYLIKYGDAYSSDYVPSFFKDDVLEASEYISGKKELPNFWNLAVEPAKPWEILAITFTNKAAGELKERIALKLNDENSGVVAGTFHSVCGRILRRYGNLIGYTSNFTIYDTDDQKRLIKDLIKQNEFDEKIVPVKMVISAISSAKEKLVTPEEYVQNIGSDIRERMIAKLYCQYEERLLSADAMDFDGMISNTVKLFNENPDVLGYYSNKFKYIMVDEYQDTNYAQYKLVKLLAREHRNICVVGDDDQSIYRFRGATIENILNFEMKYPDAAVIKLEQNYRSTGNILDAANTVISHNIGRKGKNLWTSKGEGEKITLHTALDENDEARYVADKILESVKGGARFADHAILYRTNAQSSSVENVFARSGIVYRIIGGHRFFDRKEIRDVLAYLRLIDNNRDDVRLKRIINEPKRGIGDTTITNAQQIATTLGTSVYEVLKDAADYPVLSRAKGKIDGFCSMIDELTSASQSMSIHELFEFMLVRTGYMDALLAEGREGEDRAENVKELLSGIIQYENENDEATLSGYLEEIALISDIDSYEEGDDAVVLMTVHSAKGLEFERVFLVGMEQGLFPSAQCLFGGRDELEEERRLAYVAITRAKDKLYITNADTRMLYGSTSRNPRSQFVNDIPKSLCEETSARRAYSYSAPLQSKPQTDNYDYSNVFYKEPEAKAKPKAVGSDVSYKTGMRVEHKTFGEGFIIKTIPMGNDAMLEIAFDTVGTKKIMAGYAKLKILD
ncbi:MAG: UvrD-helicase domain-containing protein [Clostridia bacterium]|nr:UvrD-helicase domain-containing protein [Clostridia bacterium]